MKKSNIIIYTLLAIVAMGSIGCSSRSYANALKEEKKVIKNYIAREHINIISEPEYGKPWGEHDYIDLGDNLYFHLSKAGDTNTDSVSAGVYVLVRYKRYALTANADTASYWTTNEAPEPIVFQYKVSSSDACTGWHEALAHMKYSGAEGKIICPSKKGFTTEQSSVTPYGYDLKFQIRPY